MKLFVANWASAAGNTRCAVALTAQQAEQAFADAFGHRHQFTSKRGDATFDRETNRVVVTPAPSGSAINAVVFDDYDAIEAAAVAEFMAIPQHNNPTPVGAEVDQDGNVLE